MILERTIKTKEDIHTFQINKIYEDDHLICVDLEINNVTMSFNYYDDIGFLYLWEYEEDSFNKLLGAIEVYYDIMFDR
jgi:hypothetical protein|tara:strand:+ start:279 stop:512 length:234 start_codon:yes stop_codon:yes gene_type:complete